MENALSPALPTGEGAGFSGFKRYRSSEKECPKHQQQEFFRQPLSQGRWNKRREIFSDDL
ncbi:hypothetical protein ACM720_06980 [Neisseria sp. LNP16475]